MIIVSQNKKIIVNFDNVAAIEIIEGENAEKEKLYGIGVATTNGRDFFMGEFKKSEYAENVILDITNKYRNYKFSPDKTNIIEPPKVYTIPREEEAEK